jgi:hypothetical protein
MGWQANGRHDAAQKLSFIAALSGSAVVDVRLADDKQNDIRSKRGSPSCST